MSETNPEVIAALRKAVDADPASVPLRLHLASLLLQAGSEGAALEQFTAVLAREPLNRAALEGAAAAADGTGDSDRAASYRALLDATAGAPQPQAPKPSADDDEEDDDGSDSEDGPRRQLVGEGDDGQPWWEAIFSKVTLKDVGGMQAVKRRLDVAFLAPMRNPELRAAYGQSLRGGLLLYGPPGCGKTFIARALAGELQAKFVSIGLNEILDMYVGLSEKHVHEVFGWARRNSPCVIFFDELDALGQKRVQLRNAPSHRGIVNQLLAELDGIESDNEGVFVLAATNHPWDVDSALLRPGRFDRTILVLPPDEPARKQILLHHMKERPTDASVDVDWLALHTDHFSGADLAHLVKTAAEQALEKAVDTGVIGPIGMQEMRKALAEIKPTTSGWFETARNIVIFANQSGMYDELADYMKARKVI